MTVVSNPRLSPMRIATGNYAGNNANDRQIAVGFKCSMVLVGRSANTMNWRLLPNDPRLLLTGAILAGGSQLHATDGFTVYETTDLFNTTGSTYYYWAIATE